MYLVLLASSKKQNKIKKNTPEVLMVMCVYVYVWCLARRTASATDRVGWVDEEFTALLSARVADWLSDLGVSHFEYLLPHCALRLGRWMGCILLRLGWMLCTGKRLPVRCVDSVNRVSVCLHFLETTVYRWLFASPRCEAFSECGRDKKYRNQRQFKLIDDSSTVLINWRFTMMRHECFSNNGMNLKTNHHCK